jgi:hypothetical protein
VRIREKDYSDLSGSEFEGKRSRSSSFGRLSSQGSPRSIIPGSSNDDDSNSKGSKHTLGSNEEDSPRKRRKKSGTAQKVWRERQNRVHKVHDRKTASMVYYRELWKKVHKELERSNSGLADEVQSYIENNRSLLRVTNKSLQHRKKRKNLGERGPLESLYWDPDDIATCTEKGVFGDLIEDANYLKDSNDEWSDVEEEDGEAVKN